MAKRNETYFHVLEYIKKNIMDSTYPVYSKLPSEAEFTKELGVSRVTVRKALDTLKEEGLIESRQGSGSFVKVKNTSSFIPVIFSDSTNISRLTEAYQGIQDFLLNTGFSPLLFLRGNEPYKEIQIIEDCIRKGFKNLIVYPLSSEHNTFYYQNAMQKGANFVFLDTLPNYTNCDYVSSSNFIGGFLATKSLIDLGHKKIAFCCHSSLEMHNTIRERFEGYRFALEQNGIIFYKELVFVRKGISEEMFSEQVLNEIGDATAIFCSTDSLAAAILNKMATHPKKVALIGFDNTPAAETLSITSVNQNFYDLGKFSAELLYNRIINPQKPFEHKYISVNLVERNSSFLK